MKILTSKLGIAAIILAIFVTCLALTNFRVAFGSIVSDGPAQEDRTRYYQLFASTTAEATVATTTTATSTNINAYFSDGRRIDGTADLRGAKKVTFYFSRGDVTGQGNTGKTEFKVQVTPDGSKWYDFVKLKQDDVSSTATSTMTISAATSTEVVSMDLTYDTFQSARCIAVETTDGEHTCAAYVEY